MIQEGGRTKSHRYWPKLGSKHSAATYGKFKVTTKFRTDSGCYATTGLKVKHLLSGQERTVWHLQYTDWPDHGCPEDVQGFLGESPIPPWLEKVSALLWLGEGLRGHFLSVSKNRSSVEMSRAGAEHSLWHNSKFQR